MLSPTSIQQILDMVEDYHLAFIAEILGGDLLAAEEIVRLKRKGLLRARAEDLIREAYEFGVLSGKLPGKAPEALKVSEFLRLVGGTHPVLSLEEQQAIEHARHQAATYIRGLGNTYSKKAHQIIVDGDKRLRRQRIMQVRRVVSYGISERITIKEIAQRLKTLTQEQERDWLRIAATEVNNAMQEGRLNAILRTAPRGADPRVFKRPAPDACPYCRMLYLERDGKTPKVFHLSEIVANGSNIGRKAGRPHPKHTGWKACVESTHPWCFPAGTLILTERGQLPIEDVTTRDLVMTHRGRWRRVVELHRNHYAGQMINVNGTLTTPSHPILTGRGWVPAEGLQGGDYLLDASRKIVRLKPQDGPARTREVARLGVVLRSLASGLVPVATINLDGELVLPTTEVDVVSVNGNQRSEGQFGCLEHGIEGLFQIREVLGSLDRLSLLEHLRDRARDTSNSVVSFLDELHALLRSEFGHPNAAALTTVSGHDALSLHVVVDGMSVSAQKTGHFKYGSLLSVVEAVKQFLGEVGSGRSSRHVSSITHSYRNTQRQFFDGSVYNLSVWGDESYLANGIVVHNCRCVLSQLPDGFDFDAGGDMIYVGQKSEKAG